MATGGVGCGLISASDATSSSVAASVSVVCRFAVVFV